MTTDWMMMLWQCIYIYFRGWFNAESVIYFRHSFFVFPPGEAPAAASYGADEVKPSFIIFVVFSRYTETPTTPSR